MDREGDKQKKGESARVRRREREEIERARARRAGRKGWRGGKRAREREEGEEREREKGKGERGEGESEKREDQTCSLTKSFLRSTILPSSEGSCESATLLPSIGNVLQGSHFWETDAKEDLSTPSGSMTPMSPVWNQILPSE